MGNTTISTQVAMVSARNEHGVKLDGDPAWFNYSKFAAKDALTPPPVGARAVVVFDKAGYIRAISPAGEGSGLQPDPAPTAPAPTVESPATTPESGPTRTEPHVPHGVPCADRRIARMAALNTATAVLSSGGRAVDANEAIALAAKLEAWVYRPV